MRDMAGINFPMDRIFSQTVSGRPKGEVLNKLAADHPDATGLAFVEDKLSTLEKVRRPRSALTETGCGTSEFLTMQPIRTAPSLSRCAGVQGLLTGGLGAVPGGLGLQYGPRAATSSS